MGRMETIREISVMRDTSRIYLLKNRTIGFVPTMGALHEGHMSLIKRSRQDNDVTVVSIFVNPMQFGPGEDFETYPRTYANDKQLMETASVDVIFLPDAGNFYPGGFFNFNTTVEVGGSVGESLCAKFRPGHFKGVATVVAKFFNIVRPTKAYFGQKDYQQSLVIRKMARDLNMDVNIVVCPTAREKDGLAMSSRNIFLSSEQRKDALLIYKALKAVEENLSMSRMELSDVPRLMSSVIGSGKLSSEIQYASVYDPDTLADVSSEPASKYKERTVLAAVAIKIGEVRLIDNMLINVG
jgi:pantoate--beta-alanine ligase